MLAQLLAQSPNMRLQLLAQAGTGLQTHLPFTCTRLSQPQIQSTGSGARHRQLQLPLLSIDSHRLHHSLMLLSLHAAIRAYLDKAGQPLNKHAAIAIANPIIGDWVQMTNHHWAFSIETTRQALELDTLILLNNFIPSAHREGRGRG